MDDVIVDRALYEHGVRLADKRPLVPSRDRDRSCFVWTGLFEPSATELETVAQEFGLHPLAVEDALHAHQRPKLERYGDSWFFVLKTVEYVDSEEVVQVGDVMLFVGDHFLVSVRHGRAGNMGEVRRALEADPERLGKGPWEAVHTLADRVVDEYQSVMRRVDEDISAIQANVFSEARASHAIRIFKLKREVLEFRQAVLPLTEPMETLAIDSTSPVPHEQRAYFRDVYDHLRRVCDRLMTIDDLLTSVLNANVAQVGMRQNEDMRKISAWVAIAAIPTMVAGIYGMNFDHMPELRWKFGYPLVVGVVVIVCVLMYRNFKRRGWL